MYYFIIVSKWDVTKVGEVMSWYKKSMREKEGDVIVWDCVKIGVQVYYRDEWVFGWGLRFAHPNMDGMGPSLTKHGCFTIYTFQGTCTYDIAL